MKNDNMARRQFLRQSAAGAAIIASSELVSGADSAKQAGAAGKSDGNISTDADVLVVGGGTAGTIAAIQAARAGAKTVLLERNGQLGGTTTVGGVAFPGLFHAWGKQIIAGIGWELVSESVAMDGGKLPDFTKPPGAHWRHQVQVNQFLYSILAEEKSLKAGVKIVYYEFPLSIAKATGGWLVESVGPGTRRKIACKQVVDCTGGADVVGMLDMPRLREKETQPGSMLFKCGGSYSPGREQLRAVYVHGADSSNSITRTQANLDGRKSLLARLRKKPARLIHMQSEAAFRESYRIVGETIITHKDYVSGRPFKDAVCYAFYPVDLHTRSGVRPKQLGKGVLPTIPLRALVPKNSRNIIVAGRCVSSDRLANSGLRVQAPCMAMGQAAGVAASLAAQQKTTPLKVPLEDIRRVLRKNGAIVPGA